MNSKERVLYGRLWVVVAFLISSSAVPASASTLDALEELAASGDHSEAYDLSASGPKKAGVPAAIQPTKTAPVAFERPSTWTPEKVEPSVGQAFVDRYYSPTSAAWNFDHWIGKPAAVFMGLIETLLLPIRMTWDFLCDLAPKVR